MADEQLLERLIAEYGDELLRMCYLYLKDYQLAEDAVQETFIKAMKGYQAFRGQATEKTWLTRIAINCCKSIMRTHWFKAAKYRASEPAPTDGAYTMDDVIERSSLSAAIMELPAKYRQVIILYYYQGFTAKEMAEITGTSQKAVEQRLIRARQKLKFYFAEEI